MSKKYWKLYEKIDEILSTLAAFGNPLIWVLALVVNCLMIAIAPVSFHQ
jgi:hypothetical protein